MPGHLLDFLRYCKYPKNSDLRKICCNHPKIWTTRLYHRVMLLKRCRLNGKQCRPWSDCSSRSSLIWVDPGWMDGWVRVLRPFNSISVILRRWKDEHERLCAMKRRLGSGRISPLAGFEPATPWTEVGSTNRSATRTLRVDPDQTAQVGAVWSGSALFAHAFLSENLGSLRQLSEMVLLFQPL